MSYREIKALKTVSMLSGRPSSLPKPKRLRGLAALGMRYERAVAKRLDLSFNATHGQWFRFEDAQGWGHCQCDHLSLLPHAVVLFESKLTQTDCRKQINKLYRPVLEMAFQRPVIAVQICKNLKTRDNILFELTGVVDLKPSSTIWTHHFLG